MKKKYISFALCGALAALAIILFLSFVRGDIYSENPDCIYRGYLDSKTPYWEFYCGNLEGIDIKKYGFINGIKEIDNGWLIIFNDNYYNDNKMFDEFSKELEAIIKEFRLDEDLNRFLGIFEKKTGKSCALEYNRLIEGEILVCR